MVESTAHVDFSGGLGNQLFALASLVASDRPYCICRRATPSLNPHSDQDYTTTLFRDAPCTCSPESAGSVSVVHRYHKGVPMVASLVRLDSGLPTMDAAFLHIRGGDYRGHPTHFLPLEGYYERAVRHFPADTLFYVLTNDRAYAESFAFLKSIRYEFVDCDEVVGLEWMRQCTRGGICANSTYSWWGAVLDTNRTLVIPSRWTWDMDWEAKSDYTFPGAIVEDVPLDVYCIHLPHRLDRMQHIESLRARYPSLQIHVVDAIRDENGVRGCALSHKKIISDAKARRLPSVIVIEDDCDFLLPDPQLAKSLLTAVSYLSTVDIVNGCGNLPVLTASIVGSLKDVRFLKSPDVRTTHCMIYGASSYDKVLAFSEETAIDIQTNSTNMVFTYPYLATQLPSYSDIEHKDVAYRNIEASRAFVQKIVENRPLNQAPYERVNPLSVLRIPIRTNRM